MRLKNCHFSLIKLQIYFIGNLYWIQRDNSKTIEWYKFYSKDKKNIKEYTLNDIFNYEKSIEDSIDYENIYYRWNWIHW